MDAFAYRANVPRCIANLRLGAYEKNLEAAKRITAAAPRAQSGLRHQALALAYLGRPEEARAAADRLLAIAPNFTISKFANTVRTFPESLISLYAEGLRKAGLPE